MMTPVAIYKVTNILNGKMYIGQSINPEARWRKHKERSSKCRVISAAIKKHGKESFAFQILCWCPDKAYADMVETKLIEAHDTRRVGYNICAGGEGLGSGEDHPKFGTKATDETRSKIAAAKMGELNPHYGKPNSPEQKAKISASLKGRPVTWGAKVSASKKGIRTIPLEDLLERSAKGRAKRIVKVKAQRGDEVYIFESIRLCAIHFNMHEVCIQRYLRGTVKNRDGWVFSKVSKDGD